MQKILLPKKIRVIVVAVPFVGLWVSVAFWSALAMAVSSATALVILELTDDGPQQ